MNKMHTIIISLILTVSASARFNAQAEEERIANDIPTIEKINRTTSQPQIEFDGEPQLRGIAGTQLSYVSNCPVPLIMVNVANWYTVADGVWFVASGVKGPWSVAASVPAVIYTIPDASPMHFVTYIRIYDVTPQYVYYDYAPGYYSTVRSEAVTVVYGAGYVYPRYADRDVWYDRSYGMGSWPGYHHRWGFIERPRVEPSRYRGHLPSWAVTHSINDYRPQRASEDRPGHIDRKESYPDQKSDETNVEHKRPDGASKGRRGGSWYKR